LKATNMNFLRAAGAALNASVDQGVMAARKAGIPVYRASTMENAFLPMHTLCDTDTFVNRPDIGRSLIKVEDVVLPYLAVFNSAAKLRLMWKKIIDSPDDRGWQNFFHPNAWGYRAEAAALIRWSAGTDDFAQEPPRRARAGSLRVDRVGDVQGTLRVGEPSPLGQVEAGRTYRLQASGLDPGTEATLYVQSALHVLGTVTVDGAGDVEAVVVIPSDLAVGRHSLGVLGVRNGELTAHTNQVDVRLARPLWVVPTGVGAMILLVAGSGCGRIGSRRRRRSRIAAA
jgi:hypothetical protein